MEFKPGQLYIRFVHALLSAKLAALLTVELNLGAKSNGQQTDDKVISVT